jgi:N-carbamoyl-L-amino-acid hydrolase
VLESRGLPVGVVEGIVGILYHDVRIRGSPNHAGTTPMPLRRDALVAASRFVLAVDETIRTGKFCAVGTVGRLEVYPNSRNVIPGEVRLTLGLRDLREEVVLRTLEHLRQRASEIAAVANVSCEFTEREKIKPAPAEPAVMAAVKAAADVLGLPYHTMPSGAGHDAQMIARIAPMGMIFVPSVGGVSHSDREFTSIGDCANGANVLLQTILQLDSWEA